MEPDALVHYLDEYLDTANVPDYPGALNGLQVECRRDITTVALAVDACRYTIEQAVRIEADILIVHHGLFWSPIVPLVGASYRRIEPLMKTGMGLYSSHLPLDVHPEVGNNSVLCRRLNVEPDGRWASFEGTPIGVTARSSVSVGEIQRRLEDALGMPARLVGDREASASRIGIVTGGGSGHIREASDLGLDLMITGEVPHHAFFTAEEYGVNMLLAGHYATETLGIQALGGHIANHMGLRTVFIDHPTGL